MQVLLSAVIDAGNATTSESERQRFVQAIVVVVDGQETRHVVIVDKRHQVFFPGEVCGFLRDHAVNFRKPVVGRTKHVANRGIEWEVEQ